MKIKELQKEIHQNAKDHGWWDEDRSFGELIALCHSELSEALEEFRNGNEPDRRYYSCHYCVPGCNGDEASCYCHKVNKMMVLKPEGIPAELADVIIRILDMFGRYEYDPQNVMKLGVKILLRDNEYDNFGEFIRLCHRYLSKAELSELEHLVALIIEIQNFCAKEGIDLESAITEKHDYNKTRPYKHGGKVI